VNTSEYVVFVTKPLICRNVSYFSFSMQAGRSGTRVGFDSVGCCDGSQTPRPRSQLLSSTPSSNGGFLRSNVSGKHPSTLSPSLICTETLRI